jgi:hypothetical protein
MRKGETLTLRSPREPVLRMRSVEHDYTLDHKLFSDFRSVEYWKRNDVCRTLGMEETP